MQALIDKLRLDSEVALVAAENSKLFMQEEYEKVMISGHFHTVTVLAYTMSVTVGLVQIVGELGYENEYLRKTCAEQEEQVRHGPHLHYFWRP
jgi:hypothetical protein